MQSIAFIIIGTAATVLFVALDFGPPAHPARVTFGYNCVSLLVQYSTHTSQS